MLVRTRYVEWVSGVGEVEWFAVVQADDPFQELPTSSASLVANTGWSRDAIASRDRPGIVVSRAV